MKRMMKKVMVLGLFAPFFFACSADDAEMEMELAGLDVSTLTAVQSDIEIADLLGTWKLVSMTSDEAVDFDANGVKSADLLKETDCFNATTFVFDQEGEVTANIPKLSIGEEVSCEPGAYTLNYKIEGSQVAVAVPYNGFVIPLRKPVTFETDGEEEYLLVSLEEFEVEQYVKDPGNTVASDLSRIEMRFKKQ